MRQVFILGGVIYIILVLALADTNGTLLALMLPFMVYLGIGFFFSPGRLALSAMRELSRERGYPGDEIRVRVTVTNQGEQVELIQIEDHVPEGLRVTDGETRLLTSLEPQESAELIYTVTGPRGFYHFRTVEIRTSDTLQIRTKGTILETDDRLFIQPTQMRLGRLEIRPRRTRVYAGYIPARAGGSGVEFFGVREYQQGDPLRWVNWRASARQYQRFFINEFEQERVADVGVILDTRLRSEIKTESGASLFEFSVQASAALAEAFLKDGNRVGLLLYGTILDWTLPDYGKIQRERILQRLATTRPGESLVFGELENLPTRLLPPKSQIVFISPLHDSDVPVLVGLRARGYSVMVISPNPIAFELKYISPEHSAEAEKDSDIRWAARLAGLERLLTLNKLQQAGIQVLDWHIDTPLDQAISAALSRPVPVLALAG
jgi:uncharacterized protein (DUF58 family)